MRASAAVSFGAPPEPPQRGSADCVRPFVFSTKDFCDSDRTHLPSNLWVLAVLRPDAASEFRD